MRVQIEVVVWRGEIAESRHRIARRGRRRSGPKSSSKPATSVTTYRSAAKPFQVLPLVERGHAGSLAGERRGTGADVRLAHRLAASRRMRARHPRATRASGIGAGVRLSRPARSRSRWRDCARTPSSVHRCTIIARENMPECWRSRSPRAGPPRATNGPITRFRRRFARAVAELGGVAPAALQSAVDGCSVPVFALPLASMARAYARLAAARAEGDARDARAGAHSWRDDGASARDRRRGAVRDAAHGSAAGRVVAKGGAEGLECLRAARARVGGWRSRAKTARRARVGPAVIEVLDHLGAAVGRRARAPRGAAASEVAQRGRTRGGTHRGRRSSLEFRGVLKGVRSGRKAD